MFGRYKYYTEILYHLFLTSCVIYLTIQQKKSEKGLNLSLLEPPKIA